MKTGGRKKGTPNKRTQIVIDRLDELNCDPLAGMVMIAQEAIAAGDLALAGSMFKELAQYCYPKRKAIETTFFNEVGSEIEINYIPIEATQ